MLLKDAIAAADLDTLDLVLAKLRRHARTCDECGEDMDAAMAILNRANIRHPQRIEEGGAGE